MKPFDLEKAKNGAAVCMRDGTPVKILDFEFSSQEELRIVYKYKNDYGLDTLVITDSSGKCVIVTPEEEKERCDLFMAPITGYMSTYRDENGNLVGGTVFVALEDCGKERDRYELAGGYHFFRYAKVELLDD